MARRRSGHPDGGAFGNVALEKKLPPSTGQKPRCVLTGEAPVSYERCPSGHGADPDTAVGARGLSDSPWETIRNGGKVTPRGEQEGGREGGASGEESRGEETGMQPMQQPQRESGPNQSKKMKEIRRG